MNLRNVGDSKFTAHHTNSFSVSGDVLALEANRLKAVGSSLVGLWNRVIDSVHTDPPTRPLHRQSPLPEFSELCKQYTKCVPSFMVLFLDRRLTCVIRVPVRGHED